MTRTVDIDFAGGPYRIENVSEAQAGLLRDHFGPLVTAGDAVPAVTARVETLDRDDHVPADTRGWEYTLDLSYSPDAMRFAGWGIVGDIDVPVTRGTLGTTVGASDRFVGVVENFFRVIVAYRLLECGGALLHSAGILDGDGARVFVGESGAGKSTLSESSAKTGREVLSDELNALWRTPGGGARVEKLPFAGDFGGAPGARASYPVLGVYRIVQAPKTRLVSLSGAQSLAALVAASPFVNGDPHRNAQLLTTLSEVSAAIKLQGLEIALDQPVWEVL